MATYQYGDDRTVTSATRSGSADTLHVQFDSLPALAAVRLRVSFGNGTTSVFDVTATGSFNYDDVQSVTVLVDPAWNDAYLAGSLAGSIAQVVSGSMLTTDPFNGSVEVQAHPAFARDDVGTNGADTLEGDADANHLVGLLGDDLLLWTAGGDTLDGGGGADTADFRNSTAGVTASLSVFTDGVIVAAGATLVDIENLAGTGQADLLAGNNLGNVLAAGDGQDTLQGLSGNDSLQGGAGDDSLDGGLGNDSLAGGAGNDIYRVDAAGDSVVEAAGEGIDRVLTTLAAYTLGAEVEQLRYTGTVRFSGTGNALDNLIQTAWVEGGLQTNKVADDTLVGGEGNDTLDAGAGNDLLSGGGGADVFQFSMRSIGRDVIQDFGFGGADRIDLSALHIPDFVTLQGYMQQSAENVVIQFSWNNQLESITLRNNSLSALTAAQFVFDTSDAPLSLQGTSGSDFLFGAGGNDSLDGGAANDRLVGGRGDDLLQDAAGNDLFVGGRGADTFLVGQRGFGNDTVQDLETGDRIDLRALNVPDLASLLEFTFQATPDDVTIRLGTRESLVLKGQLRAGLSADSFVFAAGTLADAVNGTTEGEALFGGGGNDTLSASGGNDTLLGGAGDDVLIGGTDTDRLYGGAGGDRFTFATRIGTDLVMDFGAGNGDRIDLAGRNIGSLEVLRPHLAQVGADAVITLGYNGVAETIIVAGVDAATLDADDFVFRSGTDGIVVTGTSNSDLLFGGLGDDTINGAGGSLLQLGGGDTLVGGGGNDVFVIATRPMPDTHIADFTAGDRIDVSALNIGDFATLRPFLEAGVNGVDGTLLKLGYANQRDMLTLDGVALGEVSAEDFIFRTSTEGVVFTAPTSGAWFGGLGHDQLYGSTGRETLSGGAGDDWLVGGGNADTLVGGTGNDRLTGGTDSDWFQYLDRGFGEDTIADLGGTDRIRLEALNVDTFEQVQALATQDGADTVIRLGLGGRAESIRLVNVSLSNLTAAQFGLGSSATALEIVGSTLTDVLLGSSVADSLEGDFGQDKLFGNAGDDRLVGNKDNDTLWGGSGRDVLNGGAEYDILYGGDGADTLTGEAMDGGLGNDTFTVVLATDTIVDAGGTDLVRTALATYALADGLENLSGTSSSGAQVLAGNAAANRLIASDAGAELSGRMGNDTLDGGDGNDVLVGGDGADRLTGFGGVDVFRFASVGHSTPLARDTIRDFDSFGGGEKIDLAAIDAVQGPGDQVFTFAGAAALSGVAGELVFRTMKNTTVVQGDVDGDGVADLEILLNGVHALQASHFLL